MVKDQNTDCEDGQILARFASRNEMFDGEAIRCGTHNSDKTILLDDKNALQPEVRLIRTFTFECALESSIRAWALPRVIPKADIMVVVRGQLEIQTLLSSYTS